MMKITYTSIKSFLNKCVFNPKKPGPLSIISDIGNPDYYERRATEYIKEAGILETRLRSNLPYYDDKIIKAIQLLCLARETLHQEFKDLDDIENNNESKNITKETKT